jgi:serine protease
MKKKLISGGGILGITLFLCAVMIQFSIAWADGPLISARQQIPSFSDYTDQLIVKYRNPALARTTVSSNELPNALINERVNTLSAAAGVQLTHFRFMSGDGHVLKLPKWMTLTQAKAIARKLAADPSVEYAEPDRRMFAFLTPNDPQYTNQWNLKTPGTPDNILGGANLPGAWDITTGSASIVVAVIDTGLRPHVDIDTNILDGTGRVVPGYDFVSPDVVLPSQDPVHHGTYFFTANDGSGRDSDPSDPGDWITAAEADGTDPTDGWFFSGCDAEVSSWHGTHVAGIIGANGNNEIGIAGINWNSKILPVRVLGKCGGSTSDVVDGMTWAAGLSVPGAPANANPAKVLNLSLGGVDPCSTTMQNAVNSIIAAGATIVAAAGNHFVQGPPPQFGQDASGISPANCNGVISVAATNRVGGRAFYSNFGTIVKIAAPGGEWIGSGPTYPDSILSTLNTGTTSPVASPGGDTYYYYQGTSMAAPHVAGIISLMLSQSPSLTPAQILSIIQATARTFPTGTGSVAGDCTTSLCGAGIINAAAAVADVSADLSLVIATPTPAPPLTVGNAVSQIITVTNNGPGTAFTTTMTSNLSGTATVSSVSAIPSQGSCAITPPSINCSFGTINNGATATVTFAGTPASTGTLIHTASVSSAMNDPVPGNNSAIYSTTVVNPVPAISSLSPSTAFKGGALFTLTVNGSNFVSGSQVKWNGTNRTTTFVSYTQLTATIPASDITVNGTSSVTVFNPTPGGGTSSASTFTTSDPPPPSGGGGGGCFIATAAFGSPLERHVQILRDFRDRILLTSSAGKAFVDFYYKTSPAIADKIAQSEGLRLMMRWSLMPVIGVAYLIIHWGMLMTMLLFTIIVLTVIFTIRILRKKIRKSARAKAAA